MNPPSRRVHPADLFFLALCLPFIAWITGCTGLPRQAGSLSPTKLALEPALPERTDTNEAHALAWDAENCADVQGKIELACTSEATGLKYWLYLPAQGVVSANAKPPLLIYLHGFSHSGSDLNRLLDGGLPKQIENKRALPMIAISPQCPTGSNWQTSEMVEQLSLLVNETVRKFDADPQRVYLTGFSMGGDGAWALGIAHPEQFAALAPVGSWYQSEKEICKLKAIPVWDFQGEMDGIVSPQYAKQITSALQRCGGRAKLTLFPNADHEGSSGMTYAMDEFYQWMIEQKKE